MRAPHPFAPPGPKHTGAPHPLQVLVALGEDIQAKHHLLPKHDQLLKTIESGRIAYRVVLPVALVVLAVLTYTLLLHPPSDNRLIAASVRNTSISEGLTALTLRKALPPSAELDEMIANGEYIDFGYLMIITVFASPVAQVSRRSNLKSLFLPPFY